MKENYYADKLINLDLVVIDYTWWNEIHPNVTLDFNKNKLGLPNFCFLLDLNFCLEFPLIFIPILISCPLLI